MKAKKGRLYVVNIGVSGKGRQIVFRQGGCGEYTIRTLYKTLSSRSSLEQLVEIVRDKNRGLTEIYSSLSAARVYCTVEPGLHTYS
jgi:hypothetical protein